MASLEDNGSIAKALIANANPEILFVVRVRLARWSFDALPSKKTSVDGP